MTQYFAMRVKTFTIPAFSLAMSSSVLYTILYRKLFWNMHFHFLIVLRYYWVIAEFAKQIEKNAWEVWGVFWLTWISNAKVCWNITETLVGKELKRLNGLKVFSLVKCWYKLDLLDMYIRYPSKVEGRKAQQQLYDVSRCISASSFSTGCFMVECFILRSLVLRNF